MARATFILIVHSSEAPEDAFEAPTRSVGCASALIPQQLRFSANPVTTWCRKNEKITTSNSKDPGESAVTQLLFPALQEGDYRGTSLIRNSALLQNREEVKTPTLSSAEALCEMGRRFRVAHRLDAATPATRASTNGPCVLADRSRGPVHAFSRTGKHHLAAHMTAHKQRG